MFNINSLKNLEVIINFKELDRAVGERAKISALVSTRSLEIRDLDETVEKEEVVSALCLALGRPALDRSCRLFTSSGGVRTAEIQLAEADATRLLQMGPGAAATPTGRMPIGDAV